MKDVKGWEGKFAVTPDGRVWSYWKKDWLALNNTKQKDWYQSVSFGTVHKGDRKGYKVHRLVAEAFIPNPKGLKEVNHKNGVKTDNRVENLEWVTRKRNLEHARENGWIPKVPTGAEHHSSKLTWEQAEAIRAEYQLRHTPHRKLCLRYGVSFMTVGQIIRNKSYVRDTPTPP